MPYLAALAFVLALISVSVALLVSLAWMHERASQEKSWPSLGFDPFFAVFRSAGYVVLAILLVVIPVSGVAFGLVGVQPDYGTGRHIGAVVEVEQRGRFWKTWEVRFLTGSDAHRDTHAIAACSVRDERVVASLKANIGRVVVADYSEWATQPWRFGETDCEVLSVSSQLEQ
jgi:cell division protein FtsW (lipid II flippase)